jgi:hypothetical protein
LWPGGETVDGALPTCPWGDPPDLRRSGRARQ